MYLLEFLEKSNDIIDRILPPSKIIMIIMVSKEFRNIIEKYQIPIDFIFNNLYVSQNKNSELIVNYLENNINKFNITNLTLNCNIKLIKKILQTDILQQYKNITKIEFSDMDLYSYNNIIDTNKKILFQDDILQEKELLQLVCPKLNELNLISYNFTSIEITNIFNILSNLTSLEIFKLHCNFMNNKYIDQEIKKISYLINLKKLDLSNNYITNRGVKSLFEILPKLKNLIDLNFSYNYLHEEGAIFLIKGLSQLTKLQKLNINTNNIYYGIDYLSDTISNLTLLNSLNLNSNNLGLNATEHLCRGLLHLTNLTKLDFGHNYIRVKGVKNFIKVLQNLNLLISLDLSYNYLETEGIKILSKEMSHLTQLQKLNISSNIISFEGVTSLIEVLQKLENLIDLNISHNLLEPNGIKILVKGIFYLKQLNKLDISCNYIRYEGLSYLVDVLKERCTLLTDLNLSGNEIGIYKSLSEVLNICNKLQLKKLYLNNNNFGYNFGSYKTNTKIDLDINTSVKYLDISFNYSEILQILSLIEIVENYKSLSNIKLSNSYFKFKKDCINTIKEFKTKLKIDIV